MTIASVADFVEALRDSQLLEPAQLTELAQLQEEVADPLALARQLVQRGWLTPYQTAQVQQGNGRELVLGPYRLLELLGEGGMGQVFKAVHQRLNRVVALKIIRPERVSQNPEAIRRFQREARAAAQLSHPNVVIIYDADQIDGKHFISMEYVEGIDLGKLVQDSGPLPVDQACDYMRQAAIGLQHAYERDMVHRDIKPSNLLVSRPPVRNPTPTRGSGLHRRPVLPGTTTPPDKQAPHPDPRPQGGREQRSAQPAPPPPGGREDTNTPPEEKSTPHREGTLASPAPSSGEGKRGSAARPAPWQGTVVKILDMGLARVIASPDGGFSDSSLTQEGMVMGTPDYIAPEQARNSHQVDIRADLYSLGCTFYYLLSGQPPFPKGSTIEKLLMHQLDDPEPLEDLRPTVPAGVQEVVRKLMAKRPEDRFQTPAELAESLLPWTAPEISLTGAQATVAATKPPAATDLVPVQPAPLPPTKQMDQVGGVSPAKKVAVLKGHRGWVSSLAFAPDRDTLASGGVDGTVRLWNFSGGKPKERTLPQAHPGDINALAFAPDNSTLASGSGTLDALIWLWDLEAEEPRGKAFLKGHQAFVNAVAFSPDGKVLASGGGDRTVRLWDLAGREPAERSVFKGHTDHVKALAFAPDGRTLASGSQDGTVRLWSLGWRIWSKEQAVLYGGGEVHALAFAPDGKTLASGSMDQVVRLWDLSGAKPEVRRVLEGNKGVVRLVLFTPDGSSLLAVGAAGLVVVWDAATGARQREWLLPATMVSSGALTHDGRYLATGHSDGTVSVFRLASKEKQ